MLETTLEIRIRKEGGEELLCRLNKETWVQIAQGELKILSAVLFGKLQIQGNISLVQELLGDKYHDQCAESVQELRTQSGCEQSRL